MSGSYQRKSGFREQRMGDEVMVFDVETDKVHVLNATSAFVWDCLAQPQRPGELVARIEAAFSTDGIEDVAALVQRALDQLAEKGLVGAVEPRA